MAQTRVLILDDEPIVCVRLKPALVKVGFAVKTFSDSQEALDCLAREKFDIVVTDLKMRGPDGMDILRYVRESCPGTRVVIITGFATVEKARDAMKGGAVDFVAKPFKMSQLRELLQRIAEEQQEGKENAASGEGEAPA